MFTEIATVFQKEKSMECSLYDFVKHNRSSNTVTVEPRKVILLEGIMVLQNEEVRDLLHLLTKSVFSFQTNACFKNMQKQTKNIAFQQQMWYTILITTVKEDALSCNIKE